MKLYSHSQLLKTVLMTAVVACAVTAGVILLWPHATSVKGLQAADALNLAPISADTTGTADNSLSRFDPDERENIEIYRAVNEGVVNITTEVMGYNLFLEPVPQSGGTGSGSIIDKRGYVLTNHHVVANAVKVYVTLYDGTQYEGRIVGQDLENDLAVVKFDPKGKDLTVVPLGRSDDLMVGQKVLAIGNPFALDRTMTQGIVSALGRPLRSDTGVILHKLIQTDASINPGNSGGPLLNSHGKMIGINTMIYSPSGGSVGIGFAVPVDTARRVIPDLIEHGKVIRGWIDIVPVQLFPQLVRYANLPVHHGLLISKVTPGSLAQRAGLRGGSPDRAVRYGSSILYLGGDIITAINGQKVASLADLYGALEASKPGNVVQVTIWRDGREKVLSVTLDQRPDNAQWESS
ncbi:MAG: trypsin-like serine protease [Spirochaetales bacterium]|nr:trypsin-like serine protease [Spirochaetales bacterium]